MIHFSDFDDYSGSHLGNTIIASAPEHLILNTAFDILVRNYFNMPRPDYIKYPCSSFAKAITTTGPTLLMLSANKSMNQGSNVDVVWFCVLFRKEL